MGSWTNYDGDESKEKNMAENKTNFLKLIGYMLVGSGILLVCPFLHMFVRAVFDATNLSLVQILYMGLLEFLDRGFAIFHYPALCLILLGIICLKKQT